MAHPSRAGSPPGRLLAILQSALLITTLLTPAIVGAAVSTDQADYSPGSVVTISGDSLSGETYYEGNTVEVAVTGPVSDAYPDGWPASCTATVDADGAWSCEITLDANPDVAVGAYTYTATQLDADGNVVSTETGEFTDARNIGITSTDGTWHRTGEVAGGFNVLVSGTYNCTSTAPSCGTGVVSIVVTVEGLSGSKAATYSCTTSCTGSSWSATLQFRTSGGDFAIPAGGQYKVVVTMTYNTSSTASDNTSNYFGVDNAAPTTDIQCDGTTCANPYAADVQVKLFPKDGTPALSGLASTVYCVDTTNTCTPGTSYPGGPGFDVTYAGGATYYVRYRSTDNAGNIESTKSQTIQFTSTDGDAPTVAWDCSTDNGGSWGPCDEVNWYTTDVWVRATVADNAGGSGLDVPLSLTAGSDATESTCDDVSDGAESCVAVWKLTTDTTGATYTVTTPTDVAGNVGTTSSVTIKRDATDPSVAITAPTDSSSYLPSEYIALCAAGTSEICGTASDATSGLATTNGVEAQVKWNDGTNDLWFDGTDFTGNTTETWNDVTGSLVSGAWSLPFNPALATGTGTGANWIGYTSEAFVAKARATDNAGNSATTGTVSFTVAKATRSVVYTGTLYIIDGGTPLALAAHVNSIAACANGVTVHFDVDDGNGVVRYNDDTDASGDAAANGPSGPGIYDIMVSVDETLDCLPASDATIVTVVSPGDAANGGGWYKNNYNSGSPRINFGFTVRLDCGSTANPCSDYPANALPYKGQFVAINNAQWRLKGTLDFFGNTACPTITDWNGVCGSVRGAGKLYSWDQTLNGGLGDWVFEANVTFTAGFYDGGSSKRSGSKPDYAGILTITGYSGSSALPTSVPIQLMGGNVTLSSESVTTTTTTTGKGGKALR